MIKLGDALVGFNLRSLLLEPTDNTTIQAFRAFIVGGIAFIADAGTLWLLSLTGLHYLVCAALSFIVGVMVNYLLSIKFVFSEKARMGKVGEITIYVIVSLVGLGLTEVLMWFFTEVTGFYFMISKGIAALIAFAWNFTSRKVILYRKAKD